MSTFTITGDCAINVVAAKRPAKIRLPPRKTSARRGMILEYKWKVPIWFRAHEQGRPSFVSFFFLHRFASPFFPIPTCACEPGSQHDERDSLAGHGCLAIKAKKWGQKDMEQGCFYLTFFCLSSLDE